MLQVKPMRVDDFQFATELANTMNWNMAPEDFEFNLSLEPEGCFVAFDGSKRIGIATCISFGSLGWFGNLIVSEKYRKKGVGSLLVQHSIDYLRINGVKTIGLYAYTNLVDFYSGLGFKKDNDFTLVAVDNLDCKPTNIQIEPGVKYTQEIEKFDNDFFGGNRAKLLESVILEKGNLSYCCIENGQVIGYVAATVYEKMAWVGPLICKAGKTEVANSLVTTVLSKLNGLSIYAAFPKKEIMLSNLFTKFGFKEEFSVSRMFFGENVSKNCIYLAESLERG
jgi:GNAT superfamily N-acetyltransferase